jgi:N-carbamoyl-L-amino-acid hydrolase
MTKIASNLQIDSARLWDTIHETAKFGATPKGGVRRLTLGPEDKQVRDWFRNACEAAGLEVHVDALGSMFALRKGRDMSKPPVGLGSHLDTQPTGWRRWRWSVRSTMPGSKPRRRSASATGPMRKARGLRRR